MNPDDRRALEHYKRLTKTSTAMAAAKQAQDSRDFAQEIHFWTAALNMSQAPAASPLRAYMLAARAGARLHVRDFAGVYADCGAALEFVDDCREARLTRGKCLVAQGKTAEAEV